MMVAPTATPAESALRKGEPRAALTCLQEQVRANPSDAKLRIFLFQLLAVCGEYERAVNQLAVSAQLDAGATAMAQTYREAIRCELYRREVFAGRRTPLVLGDPQDWTARLAEALALDAAGQREAASVLRTEAFASAPACAGRVDGRLFAWIADADSRLGPVLEAIVNGIYYWLPFVNLARLEIDAPEDLRDLVWTPARLHFTNGGGTVALIPTRYVGSEATGDAALQLARRTEWREAAPDVFAGLGQRLLATDAEEFALHEARVIEWDRAVPHATDNRDASCVADHAAAAGDAGSSS